MSAFLNMKTNKGFAPVAIVFVVVALLVLGGLVYYKNKTSISVLQNTKSDSVNNTDLDISKIQDNTKNTSIINLNNTNLNDVSTSIIPTSITIISPNGGEKWDRNSTQKITWKYNDINSSSKVDLYLTQFVACPHAYGLPDCYPIVATLGKNMSTGDSYLWKIVTERGTGYKISICLANTSTCDESNESFTIIDPAYEINKPPVITSISGPKTATVGQSVTYTINAYDPEGGKLLYWPAAYAPTYTIPFYTVSGNTITVKFPISGTFKISALVKDDVDKEANSDITVEVQ